MQTVTELADQLSPFWQRDIDALRLELSGIFAGATNGSTETLTRHELLGTFHELPTVSAGAVLIGPELSSGEPGFRLMTITDINAALASRSVGAGSGISGGGNLGSNISISVDQGYSFVWTAAHTFNSAPTFMTGATIQGNNPLVFGGGSGTQESIARTNNLTLTQTSTGGAAVFETNLYRALGSAAAYTLDDRTTPGITNRWHLRAQSGVFQWKINNATADVLFLTDTGVLKSPAYVSQTTGAAVDWATGAADFRYIFTDELHAKAFIADLEQALAGAQIISKSVAMLHLAFTAPAAGASTTLTMRDLPSATGMQVFPNGDYIRVRTFSRSGGSLTIGDCWGTVTLDTSYGVSGYDSATKTQRYTFTRSSGADAGAMASGTVIQPDAVILDYGTAGNGIAEVNAIDGVYGQNSPYYRVATWSTHPRTMTERVRMGSLRGITSVANEFGLWFGDGGITNSNRYGRFSTQAFELNNLNIQIYDAGTRVFFVDSNNHYLSLGDPAPTSWLTGTGFWVGDDSGTYKLQIGSASGGTLTEGMSWSGTAFALKAATSSFFLDADGARLKLPSGSSLTYVPNSSIAWSTTPETPGTESIFIRAARSTGGVFPANSLDIYAQDTGASRQATVTIGASNGTGGGAASIGFFSQGDGVDYITATADTISLTAAVTATSINIGSATGATSGQVRAHELYLGTGSDVRLYRSAADMLRTPDSVTIDAGLNLGTATSASAGSLRASGTAVFIGGVVRSGDTGSGGAVYQLWNDSASADNKRWDITTDTSNVYFRAQNDAGSTNTTYMYVNRTGTTVNGVYFPSGPIGMGTTAPQAKLHTYDTDGGTLHNWRATGIAGTRVTIIPNGTGDCTQSCAVFGTAYDSSGNAWELRGSLESGASAGSEQTVQVAGDATDNLHVKVKTDGQIEIVRNAGARTWSVCLSAWWR